MNLLLDTPVLLWWLDDNPSLSARAREAIADSTNLVFVSAATIWEIVIKKSLGKLVLPDDFDDVVGAESMRPLPITWAHALRVGHLPDHHRDPFDRILIAQSVVEQLTLVSRDGIITKYDVDLLKA